MKKSIPFVVLMLILSFQLYSIEIFTGGREMPVAEFQADLTLVPVEGSVNFSDLSTGGPVSWEWAFEGGVPSTFSGRVPPAVYYNSAGMFDVQLIVENADGSDTLTKTGYIEVVGYPAGWDYTPTGTSHIISVPSDVTFINRPLSAGDFIGAFYIDENDNEKCGGANVWDGVNNKAVLAFGDDATTPDIKEGFGEGELFIWKVFFTDSISEKYAFVTYNQALPNHDGKFYDNGLSSLTSIDTDPLFVNATANPEAICLGDEVQLNAEVGGGTGNYSFSWTSEPAGFTSNMQNPVDNPAQTIIYYVEVDDGNQVVIDFVSVELMSPTANAGEDQSTCGSNTVSLTGTATNYSSVFWSTNGDGNFTGQDQLNATYAPGSQDIANGTVLLKLIALPINPCTASAQSSLYISVISPVAADAGGNETVCYNQTNTSFALDATVENASGILWETGGDGGFSSTVIEDPVYTPGDDDLATGEVILTITADPTEPCSAVAEDQMTMTFIFEPEVFAGGDATVCETGSHQLDGATADNFSSLLWETAGDGWFDNTSVLNPEYTPGLSDISTGSVVLTITAEPVDPCTASAQSGLALFFIEEATSNAGEDATLCILLSNPGIQLNGSVSNASHVLWETGGDGNFSDKNIVDPVYTPGVDDLLNNQVSLSLTAYSNEPCTFEAVSLLDLDLVREPFAKAGSNASICEGANHSLDGAVAANYSSVLWSTDGDGGFDVPGSVNPVYTPGSGDIETGSVELCITAEPNDPCTVAAINCIELTILPNNQITVPAGWSGLSTFFDPTDPDVEDLMSSIVDDLMILYNFDGQVYQPVYGVNTIGDWDSYSGYFIKLENETTLNTCGGPVASKSLNLVEGWNVIPVLSDVDVPVGDVFDAVSDKVIVIQEIAGTKLWYPNYGIYSLETLMAGKAYLVKLNEGTTITYP